MEVKKVICNKAKECMVDEKCDCAHNKIHDQKSTCDIDTCAGNPEGDVNCIPVEPESKRTVIKVKGCHNCLFYKLDDIIDKCKFYNRDIIIFPPNYCKVVQIIIVEKEIKQ